MVHKKFEGYRNSLDKKQQEVFDWLVFEVAGMREETLVMHHDYTEAMLMNILVGREIRLQKLELNDKLIKIKIVSLLMLDNIERKIYFYIRARGATISFFLATMNM